MVQEQDQAQAGLLYGVRAIGAFLELSEPQARHLCENGTLPTFKVGRMICSRRSTLNTWLAECEAAAKQARNDGAQ